MPRFRPAAPAPAAAAAMHHLAGAKANPDTVEVFLLFFQNIVL